MSVGYQRRAGVPAWARSSSIDQRRAGGRRRETARRDAAAEEPRRPSARPRPRGRDEQVSLDSVDDLVEYFIAAGKKGIAINRYKGLGEMNPEQLWETTMKPEERTLLQVRPKTTPKRT